MINCSSGNPRPFATKNHFVRLLMKVHGIWFIEILHSAASPRRFARQAPGDANTLDMEHFSTLTTLHAGRRIAIRRTNGHYRTDANRR
jgi:hypothetical protein